MQSHLCYQVREGDSLTSLTKGKLMSEHPNYLEALAAAGKLAHDNNQPYTVVKESTSITYTPLMTANPNA
jgi:hypothetical protein